MVAGKLLTTACSPLVRDATGGGTARLRRITIRPLRFGAVSPFDEGWEVG